MTEEAVAHFLYRVPEFGARLEGYRPTDNSLITAKLDELPEGDWAVVKRFHGARRL